MTPSQADKFARQYRIMASRMFDHLVSGKAKDAKSYDAIKAAHDAACRAFIAIEQANGI